VAAPLAVSRTVETGSAASYVVRTFRTVVIVHNCHGGCVRFDRGSGGGVPLDAHVQAEVVSVVLLSPSPARTQQDFPHASGNNIISARPTSAHRNAKGGNYCLMSGGRGREKFNVKSSRNIT
jgi:hypothetical protein